MNVTVEIPNDLARQMHLDGPEAKHHALIKLAVASYNAGELSRGQVGQLLNLSFWETETFLKEHGCNLKMTVEEFERDYEQAQAYLKQ